MKKKIIKTESFITRVKKEIFVEALKIGGWKKKKGKEHVFIKKFNTKIENDKNVNFSIIFNGQLHPLWKIELEDDSKNKQESLNLLELSKNNSLLKEFLENEKIEKLNNSFYEDKISNEVIEEGIFWENSLVDELTDVELENIKIFIIKMEQNNWNIAISEDYNFIILKIKGGKYKIFPYVDSWTLDKKGNEFYLEGREI